MPLDSALAQHLAAPTSACGSSAGELSAQNAAYQSLLSDRRSALAVEAQALERRESGGGWTLLLAQARFARGDLEGASMAARESVGSWPACTPAWLIEGRIRDLRGEADAAVAAYRLALATPAEGGAEGGREVVATRLAELIPILAQALTLQIDREIARGLPEQAEAAWEELQQLGASPTTLARAEAAIAAAKGESLRELSALRRLFPVAERDEAVVDRWAALELEWGDPATGVRLLEELVAKHPSEPRWKGRLQGAKFRWRLTLLPPRVREVLKRQQLTRSDLAVALYWVMPGVRHARSQAISIATDVVDHPWREEIVRVLNLRLMEVDEALHNFWPTRPTTRGEALSATLEAAALSSRASCSVALGGGGGREGTCRAAVACGLLATPEECLSSAPISGPDLIDWFSAFSGTSGEGGAS